jgi:hypothetical protein
MSVAIMSSEGVADAPSTASRSRQAPGGDSGVQGAIRTLIDAARLAPSGDNTQPCALSLSGDGRALLMHVDPRRDPSPMNAGQRMAEVACGAALENIAQTARHNGWAIQISPGTGAGEFARIEVAAADQAPGKIEPAASQRCTNRRAYNARPLPPDVASRLTNALAGDDEVGIDWVLQRGAIGRWSARIGAADAAMFGDREFLLAFLANVRFDLPVNAAAEEGLPVGSLEVSAPERLALPRLPAISRLPLAAPMLRRSFAGKAAKLVRSSSGLCIIRARAPHAPDAPRSVGRWFQRAWLELTRAGLAVQPMMSLPVLGNYARCFPEEAARRFAAIAALLHNSELDPDGEPPAAILRFGYAAPPTARTGRRPLHGCMGNSTD